MGVTWQTLVGLGCFLFGTHALMGAARAVARLQTKAELISSLPDLREVYAQPGFADELA